MISSSSLTYSTSVRNTFREEENGPRDSQHEVLEGLRIILSNNRFLINI